jgi:broad specificity phosphatase PhoE
MRLYFVRHGESEANVLHEVSNRGYKHPLTENGRQQAAVLARSLAGVAVTRIYTSPLMRAVQTAEILAAALGAGVTMTSALREYDCGVLEGRSDEACWQEHSRVREDWLLRGDWGSRSVAGESFLDIRARFEPFVRRLIAGKAERTDSLVVVGHGGLYIAMLPLVLENVSFAFAYEHEFPNTGYVLAETLSGGLMCLEWCRTPVEHD